MLERTLPLCLVALAGCTFFEEPPDTLVTQNLELWGDFGGDGEFRSVRGDAWAWTDDLDRGVEFALFADDYVQTVSGTLAIDGDLGALCPGSRVDLQRSGAAQMDVSAAFAPEEMTRDLERLRATMDLDASGSADTYVVGDTETLTLTAEEVGAGDWTRIELRGLYASPDGPREFGGSFEVMRVEGAWD